MSIDNPLWEDVIASFRRKPNPAAAAAAAAAATESSPCCYAPCEQSDGNVICQTCRTLLDRQIDYGAEWRYYGAEDTKTSNPTRCCPPTNGLLSQTLGSTISSVPRRQPSQWQNRTACTAAAAEASATAGKAIQRHQSWSSMVYKDRVLCGVFDGLAVNAAQHGLSPCLVEEAKALYKRFADARITRGESRNAAIAASVYVSCLNNGVTRSRKEIARMFGVGSPALTKACRAFGEVVRDTKAAMGTSTSIMAEDFVGRFCSRLYLDAVHVQQVREVVRRADDMALACDAMPPSIAAGAISLVVEAHHLKIACHHIAEACAVAPTTVQKLHRRLAPAS